jgi:hypothetical protein
MSRGGDGPPVRSIRPFKLTSLFDCSTTGLRNRDADDLHRLAATRHWLAHYCCGEPFVSRPASILVSNPWAITS